MNLSRKVIKCSIVAGLFLPVFFNSLYAFDQHDPDRYHTQICNNTKSDIYVCGPEIHMTSRCETDMADLGYVLVASGLTWDAPLITMPGLINHVMSFDWERCVLRFPLAFDPSDITGEGRDSNMVFISEMTAREHDDSGFFWYDDKLVEDRYNHGEENAFLGLCYGKAFPKDLYNVNVYFYLQKCHDEVGRYHYENWVKVDINENVKEEGTQI